MNRTPSVNLIWITLGNGYIILFSSVFIVLSIYCFVIAYPTNNFLITFTKLQLGVCLLLIIEKVINSYCIIKYVNARYYLFSLKKFKKRYYISFIALENINNILLLGTLIYGTSGFLNLSITTALEVIQEMFVILGWIGIILIKFIAFVISFFGEGIEGSPNIPLTIESPPIPPTQLAGEPVRISFIQDDTKECPICLEPYQSSEALHKLTCGHIAHHQCLEEWIKKYSKFNTCPICRGNNNLVKVEAAV